MPSTDVDTILHVQVELITKGHHIRLNYSLTAEAPIHSVSYFVTNPVIALTTANSSPLCAVLKAALEDPTFLPAGVVAAILHASMAFFNGFCKMSHNG